MTTGHAKALWLWQPFSDKLSDAGFAASLLVTVLPLWQVALKLGRCRKAGAGPCSPYCSPGRGASMGSSCRGCRSLAGGVRSWCPSGMSCSVGWESSSRHTSCGRSCRCCRASSSGCGRCCGTSCGSGAGGPVEFVPGAFQALLGVCEPISDALLGLCHEAMVLLQHQSWSARKHVQAEDLHHRCSVHVFHCNIKAKPDSASSIRCASAV